jgi:hypothetical protein
VHGDHIGQRKRCIDVRSRNGAGVSDHGLIHKGIVDENFHAESLSELGDRTPDPAEPEQKERLAGELRSVETVTVVPFGPPCLGVIRERPLGKGQDEHHRVLGHGSRVDIANNGQRDPALVQGCNVHRVEPDTVA